MRSRVCFLCKAEAREPVLVPVMDLDFARNTAQWACFECAAEAGAFREG